MTKNNFLLLILLILHFTSFAATKSKILDYSQTVHLKGNKLITHESFEILINSAEEAYLGKISIPFQKGSKISIHEAVIINKAGQPVRKLRKSEITTRSFYESGTFYSDYMVKTFSLKWNTYPYKIKYSYSIVEKNFISIANWNPVVFKSVPTEKASLKVYLPSDKAITIYADSIFQHKQYSNKDQLVLEYDINNFKLPSSEYFAPPLSEARPKVIILPNTFTYGSAGSFKTWQSFGNWISQLNQSTDELPAAEKQQFESQLPQTANKLDIIRNAYYYRQNNTRYINVSLKLGGLKPYPASYVCTNKYGDCKALTIYTKALLKSQGIESYYTIVNAGKNIHKLNPEQVRFQFNHVILCVPLANDTIWLENTAKTLPFNHLGSFTQNRKALLIDGEKSKLVNTPTLSPKDLAVSRKLDIKLSNYSTAKFNLKINFNGEDAAYLKYLKHINDTVSLRRFAIKNLPFNGIKIDTQKLIIPTNNKLEVILNATGQVATDYKKTDDLFVINSEWQNSIRLKHPKNRKYPIRINFPQHKIDSLNYNVPFISEFNTEIPESSLIESKFGFYKLTAHKNEKGFSIITEFSLKRGDYPLNDYPQFYHFFEQIRELKKHLKTILSK